MKASVLDQSGRPTCKQSVLKLETAEGPIVIKHYAVRRSAIQHLLRKIGHLTFAGKSATGAQGRRDTEAECLALWRRHGIDVVRTLEPATPPDLPGPWLALEFLEGRTLYEVLKDPTVAEAEKLALLRRFAPEWARRHAAAIREREPRLLHEHGTFRHVFVAGERLVTFDLEIAWVRRGRTPYLVGREIAAFLRSLGRAGGADRDLFSARLGALVEAYGDREQWLAAVRGVLRPRSPVMRIVSLLERLQRRRDAYAPRRVLAAAEQAAAGR